MSEVFLLLAMWICGFIGGICFVFLFLNGGDT